MLKEAAIDLSELLVKLENTTHLKVWFKNGMPNGIKARLWEWAENPNLTAYIQKLDDDLGNINSLKQWLTTKGPNGLDSWRYLEDAFPDRIWCIP